MNIKHLDEWYGGCSYEGYPTPEAAATTLQNVKTMTKMYTRGLKELKVEVVKRGDGKYWVHDTSSYDDDAPTNFPNGFPRIVGQGQLI